MVVMLSCFEEVVLVSRRAELPQLPGAAVVAVCPALPELLGAAVVAGRAVLSELLDTAGAKKRFMAPRCKQNLEPILSSSGETPQTKNYAVSRTSLSTAAVL